MTAIGNRTPLSASEPIDRLFEMFEDNGDACYLGEDVTMAEHMLQGATIAEKNDQPEEIIAGALLHDIGHFTSEFGTFSMDDTEDKFHEEAGARVLQQFFPPVIIDCVRHHVAAKRYLCATKPEYYNRLSEASVHSLQLQGGPMKADEVRAFEENPNLKQIIQVRYLDDSGKRAGMATPPFSHFAPLLQRIVGQHCGDAA